MARATDVAVLQAQRHTFVKGVDLYDGHVVASSTDVRIPGRGPALEVVRTYGSSGSTDGGVLGAGWNLNYLSRLIISDCSWMIVGGDGGGQRFTQVGNEFVPQKGYHTRLQKNDDGSYDFFTKGGIHYHYGDAARVEGDSIFADRPNLDFIEDTNGNRLVMRYDGAKNLTEVQELFAGGVPGRSLVFEYTATEILGERRIRRITGPLGLEILYDYDEWANLIQVTRDVRVERYEYTVDQILDRHNLSAYVDPNGHRTEYVYFEDGDLFPGEVPDATLRGKYEFVKEVHEAMGLPEVAVTGFLYDATNYAVTGQLRTVVTDARANATEYLLNENGSPERITEPGGVVTEMTWAADDIYKTSETDANQRVTLFEYDSRANLTKETIQAGGAIGDVVTEFDYDPDYNKMTLKRVENVDAQGAAVVQETIFQIDPSNGNLRSTRDAEGNVTEFDYFPNGDLQFVRGPRPGQQQSFDYDAYGNPRTATDGEGNVTTTEYL
jgi:YD repeat-containing protein